MNWSTPLGAFLQYEKWLPIQSISGEGYVEPSNAWHFDESNGDIAPNFLPLTQRHIRREIEQEPATATRLIDELGLQSVKAQKDFAELVAQLGELVANDKVYETEFIAFRRLYRQAWKQHRPSHFLWRRFSCQRR